MAVARQNAASHNANGRIRFFLGDGFAALPDFWERVDALGRKRYYEKVDMKGMP